MDCFFVIHDNYSAVRSSSIAFIFFFFFYLVLQHPPLRCVYELLLLQQWKCAIFFKELLDLTVC